MILNCIAVDDEPPALDLLCRFIGQTPYLKLAGSFNNAIESLHFISQNDVDLIFLDIQMPELSGIELARILASRNSPNSPSIIFTTAFDQFALEGYKLDVIDYLLKPFNYQEFLRGAEKALTQAKPKSSLTTEIDEDFIYLKVEFQILKVACSSILYIEGLKDYAKIYLVNAEKAILSLITLKALEEKLPKGKFLRIHRSFIVSLEKITAVTKSSVFIGSFMIPVSDQFRDDFNIFLKKWK